MVDVVVGMGVGVIVDALYLSQQGEAVGGGKDVREEEFWTLKVVSNKYLPRLSGCVPQFNQAGGGLVVFHAHGTNKLLEALGSRNGKFRKSVCFGHSIEIDAVIVSHKVMRREMTHHSVVVIFWNHAVLKDILSAEVALAVVQLHIVNVDIGTAVGAAVEISGVVSLVAGVEVLDNKGVADHAVGFVVFGVDNPVVVVGANMARAFIDVGIMLPSALARSRNVFIALCHDSCRQQAKQQHGDTCFDGVFFFHWC